MAITRLVLFLCFGCSAFSQIVRDGSIGPAGGPLTGPVYEITPDLGRLEGKNLFHSFSQFNLSGGQSAIFSGPTAVQNILSRVTGGEASSINGLIRCTIPGANLYLINPEGITFGSGARLDVSGSFIASTADYLRFVDGGRFDARDSANDVLTSADPAAFGFLDADNARITVQGGRLVVAEGKTISLVGGDITVDGGVVQAPGGKVVLVSLLDAGEVSPTAPSLGTLVGGEIEVEDRGSINVSGAGDGQVVVRGGKLVLDNAALITAVKSGGGNGGGIDAVLSEEIEIKTLSSIATRTVGFGMAGTVRLQAPDIEITGGATVISRTSGPGAGGRIEITSDDILIDGEGLSQLLGTDVFTGIFSDTVLTLNGGRGGDINIQTTEITLRDEGQINSQTIGSGVGGNIFLKAAELNISDTITPETAQPSFTVYSGMATQSRSTIASGRGGLMTLEVADIEISGQGTIFTSTTGPAAGGNVDIAAGELIVTGPAVGARGIGSFTKSAGTAGKGGDLSIRADELKVRDGGVIVALSDSSGETGNINISGGLARVGGEGNNAAIRASGAITASGGAFSGANIRFDVDRLEVLPGGAINTRAMASPNAGKITVNANSVAVDGQAFGNALIASEVYPSSPAGTAGEIAINAAIVDILFGGSISSSTAGLGNGATIRINAGNLNINGTPGLFTGVSTFTQKSGNVPAGGAGGNIIVGGERVELLDGGALATFSQSSATGGRIIVRAGELSLIRDSVISSTARDAGNAGAINLEVRNGLSITGGSSVQAPTLGTGNGGAISVSAARLLADGIGMTPDRFTGIAAESGVVNGGSAGSIRVVAPTVNLLNGATISANTLGLGAAGDIEVIASDAILLDGKGSPGPPLSGAATVNRSSIVSASKRPVSEIDGTTTIEGGDSGNIQLTTRNLTINNGAVVSTTTFTTGNGGDIQVNADTIRINGRNGSIITGIRAETGLALKEGVLNGGQGGNINILARAVTLLDGASISTSSFGAGDAGHIQITAEESIRLHRPGFIGNQFAPPNTTAIAATTQNEGEAGNGGNIRINVANGLLHVTGGAEIVASTSGDGHGGNIGILAGETILNQSAINARSTGNGDGGTVAIHAGRMHLVSARVLADALAGGQAGNIGMNIHESLIMDVNSQIRVASLNNNGGQIRIRAGGDILLQNSGINAEAAFDGGNITVASPTLIYLSDSSITTRAGRDGGNILIDPEFVILKRSAISADAVNGNGGDIRIVTENLIPTADSSITASSDFGVDGEISVLGPIVDLTGSLVPIHPVLFDGQTRLPEFCGQKTTDESSFIVRGRGGTPAEPGDWSH